MKHEKNNGERDKGKGGKKESKQASKRKRKAHRQALLTNIL